ncbi:hypothetical protein BKP45_08160 [Anaerobacillus alkalidiazotrophicus]|uniref:Uncharacterized protein n=1 Tax=Anaerobacillus alkalidiazotrophicus TaxID=472963 RepID=A0A1S2M8D0_9BACI|nr:hypothetical protein [Anaerobacillus alkalidiazotrophicus]OIJ20763.1 hypothetical protein BKP45_08160 [Anaerobacillus alkalidiazotrophicus]
MKTDGTILEENVEQIAVTPFIDKSMRVGAIDEVTVKEGGIMDELIPISGFLLEQSSYALALNLN